MYIKLTNLLTCRCRDPLSSRPPDPWEIMRHHDWQSLTIRKVCLRPICYRISSHFGLTGETLILGLRRKGIILRALMWAVTSLWPQKVAFRSQNYSARAKLMLISDQARDLVKICFEGRRPCVPFKTARLHPGS